MQQDAGATIIVTIPRVNPAFAKGTSAFKKKVRRAHKVKDINAGQSCADLGTGLGGMMAADLCKDDA